MGETTLPCPLPECRARNAVDAAACTRCGAPVRGYLRLSAHASHLFDQGLAAARQGRFATARDHLAAVVLWCPADTEARNALALAAYELGDVDSARAQWERVREQAPEDPLAARALDRLSADSR